MLEKLVNNDRDGADSLFHEFVIEKSRGIYEKMLEDDLKDLDENEKSEDKVVDEKSEETDEAVEETTDEETNETNDEAVDEDSEAKEEADTNETTVVATDEDLGALAPEAQPVAAEADPMGGDAADDMIDDMEAGDSEEDGEGDEMDMDSGDDAEEIEDRVVDLEDALDDLKAEFEKMMSDKDGGDDEEGDEPADDDAPDMDMGDEEAEEEAVEPTSELSVEEAPEEAVEGKKSEGEVMREYVNKVATPSGEDNKAKSPVASKNDMGGTASNINAGGEGSTSGSGQTAKEDNAGNVNVPGGKASKSMKNAKGHGAEKKGAGESGTDSTSVIGS